MQEDFCPNGALAVEKGRSITPVINSLLAHPGFTTRVATQDSHPPDHISFAANHSPPNNIPFESYVTMTNPAPGKETETKLQRLWPVHCVAGTEGASLIPELDSKHFDVHVKKGMNSNVEMYSAFSDAFGNPYASLPASGDGGGRAVDVDLEAVLKEKGIQDVFVVGLAGDYCVKYTAIDAAKAGFRSFVVEEGTRCVVHLGWEETKQELRDAGVGVIGVDELKLL
ncbi:nicotinamidase [Aspergillus glaucus CBS 516.65]|uniref:nicotinamidase n=1 Tax=Aspergillus glaucus CBS 516.65 TaxID=1160497 RepID=A0A1L9VSV2_ASPGL|nr:hypothetical protein ASPGLDRAFT_64280 [Aspergillus glaucus CBS 516.65]OJJ86982.1 hypothetical protein ASPGLDRAFT_64280 [Aspergillus glaucus CBS 516.65]